MLSDIASGKIRGCGVLNGKVAPRFHGRYSRRRGRWELAALLSPGAILLAGRDHHDRSRRQAACHCAPVRRGANRQRRRRQGRRAHQQADRRHRRRHRLIEAVGIPATFELCTDIIAPGGIVANAEEFTASRSTFILERLWSPEHLDHHTACRHGLDPDAAQDGRLEAHRAETSDHTSFQARPDHARPTIPSYAPRRDRRAEGNDRGA